MISLDWKKRLINDTIDFCKNKLVNNNYNFEIIYNAYPCREGKNVPTEVLSLVAKELVKWINNNHRDYLDFYRYLWHDCQKNGKYIYLTIMDKILDQDLDFYFNEIVTTFEKTKGKERTLFTEKLIFSLLKKVPKATLPYVYNWLRTGDNKLEEVMVKILAKFCKVKPDYAKSILRNLENRWMYTHHDNVKAYANFLKEICKIDQKLYLNTILFYDNTRDPNIIEILAYSIAIYNKKIEELVGNWNTSGNARIKKAASNAKRNLTRLKNKK